ncbi:glycoside hydrolase family 2 protein [Flavilitoribacter nigricans]|uniref:Beta-galactosidase n=1 Tax=Flavilitoribacter nigricans (strain ATCC 23147 / DSM 23189 / NBRC 102662 / NCIMB 1420 / SS-2) TaxID=1122177 RepID=A0A2D0NBY5_FLAN2|nr:sugar-binding domain-containing protein [Flavilitoribacter nigricans]PHN05689.1 beta-galactosidase [Flavilitoribacter nigricans DSM 23189 = NBRC 102662]
MNLFRLILTWGFAVFVCPLVAQEPLEAEVLKYQMDSKWTDDVDPENVWNVYPRPQLRRDNWTNLNGTWEYAIRETSDGAPSKYDGDILVPFAVESSLSGVKKLVGEDNYLWYRTTFNGQSVAANERLQLHFGAVDWETTVYVNGQIVGGHKGGYTPFNFDITPFLKQRGRQELVVRVWDPTDGGTQARGKQVRDPRGIWYTPVTGIWQTVWLEKTPADHLRRVKITPDIDQGKIRMELQTSSLSTATTASISIRQGTQEVARSEIDLPAGSRGSGLEIAVPNPRLWSPEDPFLYDVTVELRAAGQNQSDKVQSYFGMRKISLGQGPNGYTRIMLNNQPVFQFGLLDQGWWPDGLYTAPTEEALMYDVEMTKAFGFNLLRKHVKVEPASYYYNCDKMGMLIWQDMPNGNYFRDLRVAPGQRNDAVRPLASALQFETELQEMIDHFYAFPSIITWVPFNEGWGQYDTERIAEWVKNYDPSRLCIAPSGWEDRGVGDIIDVHLYPGPGMEAPEPGRASVLGEFGGLGYPVQDHMWWDKRNWGYLTFQDQETLEDRFTTLMQDLVGLKSQGLSGAIYTQTTDVEGEVNGMMTYDREVIKIDPAVTRKLFAPLYRSAWNKRTLLSDAESGTTQWKIASGQTGEAWTGPGFDDADWASEDFPMSSFDNPFLPDGGEWNPETELFARRTFYLTETYDQINLKYYLHRAEMDLFINGKKVTHLRHEGGRKRHYTNKLIRNAVAFLRPGRNVVAIRVQRQEDSQEVAFDLGLYVSGLVPDGKSATGARETKGTE